MGGFKNKAKSSAFKAGLLNNIIVHLIECSKQMKADCIATNSFLQNHEDLITFKLVANYLNVEPRSFRFEPESREHYDNTTGLYIGRTDLKVITSDYFRDAKAYYIIECKRIDGKNTLNKNYIVAGVDRFSALRHSPNIPHIIPKILCSAMLLKV